MKRIKNALAVIFRLMRTAISVFLAGLGFVAAAVYISFVLLALLFATMAAVGQDSYLFGVIGLALGAGMILLFMRMINRRTDSRFVKAPVPRPAGPPE